MSGLRFELTQPVVPSDPNRADIALFVGLIDRREGAPVPRPIWRWLYERGWRPDRYPEPTRAELEADRLLNVPIPIDTWDVFDHLFAWDRRRMNRQELFGTSYLGASVRSYFAQGGRKCYVVRAGAPRRYDHRRVWRMMRVERLVPGFARRSLEVSPLDRASWRGIGHLFGLPDVSFLCLPDLPELIGADRQPIRDELPPPEVEEQFVECSEPAPPPEDEGAVRRLVAPRCDEAAYEDWAWAIHLVADLLQAHRWRLKHTREVQLVAALPIPAAGTAAEGDLLAALAGRAGRPGPLSMRQRDQRPGIASAFVQLAYPWVRTAGSGNLPERLESPDGVLAGVLARSALARGAFRSAGGLHLGDVFEVYPRLDRAQAERIAPQVAGVGPARGLIERVSLLGPTPGGLELLSDVTTSLDESYRPAAVNRLVSLLVRAARRVGEELVFEAAGERLWARLRERIGDLLENLLRAGALHGASPEEAFEVRCDRGTMTQSDIDNGRAIVSVQFVAAAPIERITVVLAMDEGGQVSLVSGPGAGREAA